MRYVMLFAAAFVFLAACGKKAPLRPPGSEGPAQEEEDYNDDPLFEDEEF